MINADDMQSWAYLLAPTFQFVNTAGKPLTEGWIEVYIAGTRNKYYCASDFNGTLHPFQIPLDSLGANIVLADPDQAYDVYVYNKYGSLVMSRYHVSPCMAGGSGVLNITITSEDGTVSVNNDGNGNFDLSIQDTVDRIEVLEQTVSGLSVNSSVGYAIAHAYTVNLDGSFELISDTVTGIGYTPNMDGFRLKSGHVYQFNFNALFENGEFDRNCSGKLYLEGPNTIAQEWKFDLDDSYYHSQSINGSTVLVTPNYLNYYDVKLKLAWDVDYPNKPNVDLNKISIVDITTILSTTVSGVSGNYTGGDGIFVNDETYIISVDMDYINSHLNIDATEIIASAVNIATAYTDARVTSVSGDLVNLIAEVSASIPTGSVTQVQSDWNEQDSSSPAYIQHKPDLTVYATHDEVSGVSAVLNERITDVSGSIPELPYEEEVEFEEVDLSDYALASAIPDISNLVTHDELVSAVTAVSSMIPTDYVTHSEVNTVSGVLESEIQAVSAAIGEQVPNVSIQSTSGTLVVTETVSGNNKIYSIDVAPTTGIEYGQFYATNITGAATMSRTKGNIDITNDGKIKLKKGQSYHITVRGRYNQSVLKDNYSYASYIEYVTNNSININVDESRSDSQYFELSYDLFKLNSDTDYYVFFTIEDATVNDLFIDVHSLANVGGNGSSGGSSTEYDAGYGIQILNNVISVSGIAPQVQSDWNQTNTSSVDYIKNKPEEYGLLAGDNISITASGSNFIISSTASEATGTNYQAGYGIDITGNTISVDASIIPSTSDYATHTEVNNVSAAIIAQIPEQQINSDWTATSGVAEILNKPNESELIAGAGVSITASGSNYIISAVVTGSPVISGYVTESELQTVSGNIVNQIPDVSNLATKQEVITVSGMIPDISGLATNEELQIVSAAIPDVSNLSTKSEVQTVSGTLNTKIDNVSAAIPELPSEEEVVFEELDLNDYALASAIPDVSNLATKNELQTVSASIPDVSNFVTGPTVSAIVDEALINVTTGVSGIVAGDGISITASGSDYVISSTVTGGGSTYTAGDYISIDSNTISVTGLDNSNIFWVTNSSIQSDVYKAYKEGKHLIYINSNKQYLLGNVSDNKFFYFYCLGTSIFAYPNEVYRCTITAEASSSSTVRVSYGNISLQANWNETNSYSPAYIKNKPDLTTYATKEEVQTVSASIPDVSNLATKNELQTVSTTLESEIQTVSAALDSAIIQCGGSGTTYTAGDYIGIVDDTISVTGVTDVVAGNCVSITSSGNSAVIDWNTTGGITDIQIVNSLPASPVSTVLYLIPEI